MRFVVVVIVGCTMTVSLSCPRHQIQVASPTGLRSAECLGPTDATSFAVYLHGMDDPALSEQEVGNRANLARIAEALSIRIALPRTRLPCPTEPRAVCWGWEFGDHELDVAAMAIKEAAETCFGGHAPYGLIGFSNGGYLLSKMFRTCRLREKLPNAGWIVTIGSASFNETLDSEPSSLKGCGRMVILAGRSDAYNFDPSDRLLHALEGRGADVKGRRFDGGHLVPDEPLRDVLQELIRAH